MKLMFENSEISFEQELSEGLEKKYRIKGIFSTPEKQNKNGRIYPTEKNKHLTTINVSTSLIQSINQFTQIKLTTTSLMS
jgi:hypothetical protein